MYNMHFFTYTNYGNKKAIMLDRKGKKMKKTFNTQNLRTKMMLLNRLDNIKARQLNYDTMMLTVKPESKDHAEHTHKHELYAIETEGNEIVEELNNLEDTIASALQGNIALKSAVELLISMLQENGYAITRDITVNDALTICKDHNDFNAIPNAMLKTRDAGMDIKISTLVELLQITSKSSIQ